MVEEKGPKIEEEVIKEDSLVSKKSFWKSFFGFITDGIKVIFSLFFISNSAKPLTSEELKPLTPKTSFWKSALSFSLEILKTVIISLAIILPIRYFVIQPFMVDGASMEPNFYNKQYLVINEISYRFQEPSRGEVVVFKNPQNTKEYYIKRIIALPGETVKVEGGEIYVQEIAKDDFVQIKEFDYLPEDTKTFGNIQNLELGNDEYFVLGDNRKNSKDSRILGPIKRELITGKVWVRGFPFKEAQIFNFSEYDYGL
jgi:signal peptidase I